MTIFIKVKSLFQFNEAWQEGWEHLACRRAGARAAACGACESLSPMPEQGSPTTSSSPLPHCLVSEATHGVSSERCLILSISKHPLSEPDPSECWQPWTPRQLLRKHKGTSANPTATGVLGAPWAECWTQSCKKSTWAFVTYQKWVSFFCGSPLAAPAFDNQKRWAERVSAGFVFATLLDGAQHFSGIVPLSREGGDQT